MKLPKPYWTNRLSQVRFDLATSQASGQPSAPADIVALKEYLCWIESKLLRAPAAVPTERVNA